MFKVISFNRYGQPKVSGYFKNETMVSVLPKYRQLVSQGDIVEFIIVDEDGTPDLSGSY
jgi:hypothetical protein